MWKSRESVGREGGEMSRNKGPWGRGSKVGFQPLPGVYKILNLKICLWHAPIYLSRL